MEQKDIDAFEKDIREVTDKWKLKNYVFCADLPDDETQSIVSFDDENGNTYSLMMAVLNAGVLWRGMKAMVPSLLSEFEK